MAANLSHPFLPSITSPDAVDWADATWHTQPELVRHYIDTLSADLHDALLGKIFTVRMVLPPVICLNGKMVQLPANASAPLLGGLMANLRQHPIDADVLDALHTLQAHPNPAVAEVGILTAYRVAYQFAFKDVPPSPQIIIAHEPYGEDGRRWGSLKAAEARVNQLADWVTSLMLATKVYPAVQNDVFFTRALDALREKHSFQSECLINERSSNAAKQ